MSSNIELPPVDYHEAAKACRMAAKLFEGFRNGEAFASHLIQVDYLIGQRRQALVKLHEELEQATQGVTQAREQWKQILADADARAAKALDAAGREREALAADLVRDRAAFEETRAQTARAHAASEAALAQRESNVQTREDAVTARETAATDEDVRLTRIRDEARNALARM